MAIERIAVEDIYPDPNNPRESDDARLHLLRLSLQKLGFVQPIYCALDGMILSGHQRYRVATDLGYTHLPVEYVDLGNKQAKGINVMFNRATNDMTAFVTGSSAADRIDIAELMALAETLPDYEGEFLAYSAKEENITDIGVQVADEYNRKAMLVTASLRRYGIRIPIVMTESGEIVNGVHRLFEARHEGIAHWPVVRVPEEHGVLAKNMLNYLSMDYSVDGDFARMLRYSAYRRPQNARGILPKGMRFWAAGERTISDAQAYSQQFWENFRVLHGNDLLDFGAGLCKVGPVLSAKGFNIVEFEPYRIRPLSSPTAPVSVGSSAPIADDAGRDNSDECALRRRRANKNSAKDNRRSVAHNGAVSTTGATTRRRRRRPDDLGRPTCDSSTSRVVGKPDPEYSRACAQGFLDSIAKQKFTSIFLASVLNSIPFPRDRQCVLAIVHALCSFSTITYGTCRDISDFLYEYSGIRNASYFVFDSEPGVRLGDALSNPKIQKFHSQAEFREIASHFWNTIDTWPGGNIFYWRAQNPKRVNAKALSAALEFEFELPFEDGSTLNLSKEAKRAFSKRLEIEL